MHNNESFTNSEKLKDNKVESVVEISESELQAKEIAKNGDYNRIYQELIEKNLLKNEMLRVKSEYENELEEIDFLTEKDFEIFTILELYDKDLAFHSIETYKIAKDKMGRKLAFDIVLTEVFKKEDVTPEQFFRACFLHDIGKVTIPNFILNDTTDFKEMSVTLSNLITENDQATIDNIQRRTGVSIQANSNVNILELLDQHHIRPVHVVPVRHILSPEKMIAFQQYNLDADLSIMDIIEPHEIESEKILKTAGLDTEAELAGSHHNYHGKGSSHPLTLETFRLTVDMSELIRIADMTEALTATRSYKKGNSRLHANRIILESVLSNHYISEVMTYIWIEDEVRKHEEIKEEDLTMEDLEDIDFLKEHLEIIRKNIEKEFPKFQKAA